MHDETLNRTVAQEIPRVRLMADAELQISVDNEFLNSGIPLSVLPDSPADIKKRSIHVELTELEIDGAVSIDSDNGIWLSTKTIDYRLHRAGLQYSQAVGLCILAALPPLMVLRNHDTMCPEYLVHDSGCDCLMARDNLLAQHRSGIYVCEGSVNFYRKLNTIAEIEALQNFSGYLRNLR